MGRGEELTAALNKASAAFWTTAIAAKGRLAAFGQAQPSGRDAQIARFHADRDAALAAAEAAFQAQTNEAKTSHARLVAESKASLSQAEQRHRRSTENLEAEATSLAKEGGPFTAPWDDPLWTTWAPPEAMTTPDEVRVGCLRYGDATIPAIVPFAASGPMSWTPTAAQRASVRGVIEGALLRALAGIPAGKLECVFIDPVGRGQNVASFMYLADADPRLVGGQAWTEAAHIEQRLVDLTSHIENVIQRYLRSDHPGIESFNQVTQGPPVAYKLLVVFDFPAGFSTASAERLLSLAQSGPRCGVITWIVHNTDIKAPPGFNVAQLTALSNHLVGDAQGWRWAGEPLSPAGDPGADVPDAVRRHLAEGDKLQAIKAHREATGLGLNESKAAVEAIADALGAKVIGPTWRVEPDPPAPDALRARIIERVGAAATNATQVSIPFSVLGLGAGPTWTGPGTAGGLDTPLGPSGASKLQHFRLGAGTSHHVLLAGKTGSGKSTLLHTLITGLCLRYDPDEISLYLIDMKQVEFKIYADHQLPHAQVIAVETDREFAWSVIERVVRELHERLDLFTHAKARDIQEYRQKTGKKLPRVLLLIDEFQVILEQDDALARRALQAIDSLVRLGRAPGIHLMMASQTLASAFGHGLSRPTLGQMGVRIALICSDADSRLILGEDNGAARLLERPGDAWYNDQEGRVEGNHRFQVARLDDAEHGQILTAVHGLAEARWPGRAPVVFEGTGLGDLERHPLFRAKERWKQTDRPRLLLGDPVTLDAPAEAGLAAQPGANLLIVGSTPDRPLCSIAAMILGLALQHPPERLRFHVFCGVPDDDPAVASVLGLVRRLPHPTRIVRRRDLPPMLADLAERVEEASTTTTPTRWDLLIMLGIGRATDLREEGFGGGDGNATPAAHFKAILRHGPEAGVHVIVWGDSVRNVDRVLGHGGIDELNERLVFQVAATDSHRLVDSAAASQLGSYRAIWHSTDDGRTQRLRPYALPSIDRLERLGLLTGGAS